MPQVDPTKETHQKRYVVAGAVVVAVVLVIGVLGYLMWGKAPSATTTASQADTLNSQGRYQEAFAQLQAAYARASTTKDKALILSRMAAAKSDMGDDAAAVGYLQQEVQLTPADQGAWTSLGDLAARTGNKAVAVDAYQHVIDLIKAQSQTARTAQAIDQYTSEIQGVQQ